MDTVALCPRRPPSPTVASLYRGAAGGTRVYMFPSDSGDPLRKPASPRHVNNRSAPFDFAQGRDVQGVRSGSRAWAEAGPHRATEEVNDISGTKGGQAPRATRPPSPFLSRRGRGNNGKAHVKGRARYISPLHRALQHPYRWWFVGDGALFGANGMPKSASTL